MGLTGESAWAAWLLLATSAALSMALGAMLGPWSRVYARHVRAGGRADAAALWRSAHPRRLRAARLAADGPAALALGSLACWLVGTQGAAGLAPLLLGLGLASLAWLDARSGLLPDALTLPLTVLGWGLGAAGFMAAAGASLAVWAGLASAAGLYRRLRGRDGFGGGDVKCLSMLAGWLGVHAALGILWGASVLGLLWWLCAGPRRRAAYPLGPCLALASLPWLLPAGGPPDLLRFL
ncbi:MAG TPA: prepilin peptidase [Castellaniella sp.]|jgi:leader peptidase (prepilin peptidase)/N-methyltransferase|nr:prepilin peptidase [Castellaniella sp.]